MRNFFSILCAAAGLIPAPVFAYYSDGHHHWHDGGGYAAGSFIGQTTYFFLDALFAGAFGQPYDNDFYYQPAYYADSYPFNPTTVSLDGPYIPNYVAPPSPPPAPPIIYADEETGSYCREFSQTVRLGDEVHESYGTACLQPDGDWHIVRP